MPTKTKDVPITEISPLFDYILIEPSEVSDVTPGGIAIPDNAKEKPRTGIVLAVGPGARNEAGETIPAIVSVDDVVVYPQYAGTEIKHHGKKLLLMHEKDLLAQMLTVPYA